MFAKHKPKHIGIVACSAEGAALCYRTICTSGVELYGPHAHPEVSMHTHSLARYVECLSNDDWQGVADLMLESASKLANMGADFLICPDNTIHQAFDLVEPHTPKPWLHIADVVAEAALARDFRRLGVTGTQWLVNSDVYGSRLKPRGIALLRPSVPEIIETNRLIFDELVCGVFSDYAIKTFQQVITRMQSEGCDAVVLGCTEIPLIINDANSVLPTLDSTTLLAQAALRYAAAGDVVR